MYYLMYIMYYIPLCANVNVARAPKASIEESNPEQQSVLSHKSLSEANLTFSLNYLAHERISAFNKPSSFTTSS